MRDNTSDTGLVTRAPKPEPAGMRCGRVPQAAQPPPAGHVRDAENIPTDRPGALSRLLAERHAALRDAFTQLPPCCQKLIALLIENPPVRYARSSVTPGIPRLFQDH
jgi:hypothetical protein